jgi:hypothetical protein
MIQTIKNHLLIPMVKQLLACSGTALEIYRTRLGIVGHRPVSPKSA